MTQEMRYRTLGEVVDGPIGHEELGCAVLAAFPGVNREFEVPVGIDQLRQAGVKPVALGALFTAEVYVDAESAEELAPSSYDVLSSIE